MTSESSLDATPMIESPYQQALLIAVHDGHGYQYVGKVGTGYSSKVRLELRRARPNGADAAGRARHRAHVHDRPPHANGSTCMRSTRSAQPIC